MAAAQRPGHYAELDPVARQPGRLASTEWLGVMSLRQRPDSRSCSASQLPRLTPKRSELIRGHAAAPRDDNQSKNADHPSQSRGVHEHRWTVGEVMASPVQGRQSSYSSLG